MKQHSFTQGSPEWHAHRADARNASDAAAMLGCSPYMTRSELLHARYTGLRAEASPDQQRRFNIGHIIEAKKRPVAEAIIGEDLFPVVGSGGVDGIVLSASFDGLTMMEDRSWECKSLNEALRSALPNPGPEGNDAANLPKFYRVQLEQQCAVSGCERVLFTASDGLDDDRHCWYYPDPALRSEIVAGWKQFDIDLAAYTPPAATPAIVAEPVQALPAVTVQVTGEITIKDNFASFETALRDFLEHRLIREPKTDQDFADLDVQIKAMKGAEAALDSAEAGWIAQIEAVSTAKGRKDMLQKLVKDNRLMAEKLLASEKERRKAEIVTKPATELRAYMATLNRELGAPYIPMPVVDFAGAIKGMRSLSSMEDEVSTRLAQAKIEANAIAATVRANLKTLDELGADHSFLFADKAQIALKASDDFQTLVKSRISEHKAAEERRLEAERERIRAEELARIEREQAAAAKAAAEQQAPAPAVAAVTTNTPVAAAPAANVVPMRPAAAPVAAPATPPTLKLGTINERLAPVQLTAAGLSALGFEPAGKAGAAVLYHERDFSSMCAAVIDHVNSIQAKQAA